MLEVCAIASGSNGNCYYIGNERYAVLIDAGISAKQIRARLAMRGLDEKKIRAIVVSHEHRDHMRGVRVLSKKLNIPVYFSKGTYNNSYKPDRPAEYKIFSVAENFEIFDFRIKPFLKNHDAAEPCSFTIYSNGVTIGVMTDIGMVCEKVKEAASNCHAIFLETNYDEEMLWKGSYPWPLKQRVASDYGHLSNNQSTSLIEELSSERLHTLFLSHLSAENNTPQKAIEAFDFFKDKIKIHLTDRYNATEVFKITENESESFNY